MDNTLIPISFFLLVFGLAYLFLSIRNKERLALIEKGVDASIFMKGTRNTATVARIIILNVALLLMGIGIGVSVALFLSYYTGLRPAPLILAATFTMAGLGLLIGFYLTKKMDKKAS